MLICIIVCRLTNCCGQEDRVAKKKIVIYCYILYTLASETKEPNKICN